MPSRAPTVQAGASHTPGSPCLLMRTLYLAFYCWLSQGQAGHSVYAGSRAQHFLRCVLGQESHGVEFNSLCMLSVFSSQPCARVKQSLLLGGKRPFAFLCPVLVEDTLPRSIDEALSLPCRHSVVAHGCANYVLQSFRARVPERCLFVTLRGQPSKLLVGSMISRLAVTFMGLHPVLLMVFTRVGPNTNLI